MRRSLLIGALVASMCGIAGTSQAAVISVIGDRSELDTIASAFVAFGDTVTRYSTGWSSLTAGQLDAIFASDIVWEGDIFNALSAAVQTRMGEYIDNNGGLLLTAERPCCDGHNVGVQAVGREATGDNGLLVGQTGIDYFGHSFSNSPTTILTSPNDIRGQAAQHDGPGLVQPTGGVLSNACFITSSTPSLVCTAGAWGPDELVDSAGRLIIYGDINSQPSLVSNFNGNQFENMRQFLLAGFTGGPDTCETNPNLPGCGPPPPPVPEPTSLALFGLGLLAAGAIRRRAA